MTWIRAVNNSTPYVSKFPLGPLPIKLRAQFYTNSLDSILELDFNNNLKRHR